MWMPAFARGGGDREADAGSCGEAWGEGKHPRTPVDKHGCVAGRPAFPQAQAVANTKELFVERLPDGPAAGPQAFSQPPYPPAPLTPGARGAWSSAGRCRRPGPGEGPAGQAHAPLPGPGRELRARPLRSFHWRVSPGPQGPPIRKQETLRLREPRELLDASRGAGGLGAPAPRLSLASRLQIARVRPLSAGTGSSLPFSRPPPGWALRPGCPESSQRPLERAPRGASGDRDPPASLSARRCSPPGPNGPDRGRAGWRHQRLGRQLLPEPGPLPPQGEWQQELPLSLPGFQQKAVQTPPPG